jgi:hypothetical protein
MILSYALAPECRVQTGYWGGGGVGAATEHQRRCRGTPQKKLTLVYLEHKPFQIMQLHSSTLCNIRSAKCMLLLAWSLAGYFY